MLILPSILFGAALTLAIAWMLGRLCLWRLPVAPQISLAVGAAAESCIVFLMLTASIGNRLSFLLLGAFCLALNLWLRPGTQHMSDPVVVGADRFTTWLASVALAAYTVLYLINALASELEPDAIGYHLGLTWEYVRLAGFPDRIGFFEMLPHGFEMLFVPAFAIGRHSAARLVHLAFLLATAPLMLRIARRLSLPDRVSLAAIVLYFCSPVAGITGTSAYTDAGGVFFVLATFYLLLVWRDTRDWRYLVPAGVTAGFCYAIKIPGGLMVLLAMAFVVLACRSIPFRLLIPLTVPAIIVMAPWLLRSLILTGNPVAPLFNSFFPNPYFHVATERELAASLGSFGGLSPAKVFYELMVGGAFQGTAGPVFFLFPLALLALRRRAGRICWLAAVCVALPWIWNTGARFLMPALPFVALALAMSLPRAVVWALMVVQAVTCWPQIINLYHPQYTWRLQRIPWRAALRIQRENEYLASLIGEYQTARLIEDRTQPGERIFSLIGVATAYTDREVLGSWDSSQADNLTDILRVALAPHDTLCDVKAEWNPSSLSGVRIRAAGDSPLQWQIHDIQLLSGNQRVSRNPPWQLHASPNEWDLPLAFDTNRATRWSTWEPVRTGMYIEADFERPQTISSVIMTSPCPQASMPFEFYGGQNESWRLLTRQKTATEGVVGDLRMEATQTILRTGYRYILAYNGEGARGVIGSAMTGHEAEWGVDRVAELGPIVLFRIK